MNNKKQLPAELEEVIVELNDFLAEQIEYFKTATPEERKKSLEEDFMYMRKARSVGLENVFAKIYYYFVRLDAELNT